MNHFSSWGNMIAQSHRHRHQSIARQPTSVEEACLGMIVPYDDMNNLSHQTLTGFAYGPANHIAASLRHTPPHWGVGPTETRYWRDSNLLTLKYSYRIRYPQG